ncbi:MAG: hypothetical protein FWG32_01580 [Oscillospiraceae bacterium]|nr:hypothetical protein [Oscillospiraceae bacterium]
MKRIMCYFIPSVLLISVLFLFCIIPSAGADNDATFIAVNEILLHLNYEPYISGGTVYIPYWVFPNYFKLYYTYFNESATALLYTAEKQIYFDMRTGNTYDADSNYYPASAVFFRGQVYLPAAFAAGQFGLIYSHIRGSGYGDIVRLKDSSAILTDSEFINAAESLMRSRYSAYTNATTPTRRPEIPPPVNSGEDSVREGTSVYISFTGLPGENLLNILSSRDIKACFFLTADEVSEDPSIMRQIVNSGHRTGAACGENVYEDYRRISSLIFEAAREKTLFITSQPEYRENCLAAAEEYSLVYFDYDSISTAVQSGAALSAFVSEISGNNSNRTDIRLDIDDDTPVVLPVLLSYLLQNNFDIREVRETGR